jgi:hypothetical protein
MADPDHIASDFRGRAPRGVWRGACAYPRYLRTLTPTLHKTVRCIHAHPCMPKVPSPHALFGSAFLSVSSFAYPPPPPGPSCPAPARGEGALWRGAWPGPARGYALVLSFTCWRVLCLPSKYGSTAPITRPVGWERPTTRHHRRPPGRQVAPKARPRRTNSPAATDITFLQLGRREPPTDTHHTLEVRSVAFRRHPVQVHGATQVHVSPTAWRRLEHEQAGGGSPSPSLLPTGAPTMPNMPLSLSWAGVKAPRFGVVR